MVECVPVNSIYDTHTEIPRCHYQADLYISREVQFPRLDSLLISFWYDSPEGDEARGLLKFLQVVSVPRVSTVRIAGRLTRTSIMSDASGLAGMISLGTQVEHHARGIRTLRSLQMMFFAYVDRPGTSPKRDAADAKLASAESLISSVSSRLPHLELEQWFASSPLYWFGVFQFKIVVKEYQCECATASAFGNDREYLLITS